MFSSGDKYEGLKEVQNIWKRAKYKPAPTLDLVKLEDDLNNLPIFSVLPDYPGYVNALDSNPNI